VSEPIAFEFELAIEKHKSHKSPGIDQIPTELIKAAGRRIHYVVCLVLYKEELSEEWKEFIVVPICKKGDKRDYSNFVPTMYKILSNILLSRLTPYADEMIGDHQCGF
jgi:hypothetical protein